MTDYNLLLKQYCEKKSLIDLFTLSFENNLKDKLTYYYETKIPNIINNEEAEFAYENKKEFEYIEKYNKNKLIINESVISSLFTEMIFGNFKVLLNKIYKKYELNYLNINIDDFKLKLESLKKDKNKFLILLPTNYLTNCNINELQDIDLSCNICTKFNNNITYIQNFVNNDIIVIKNPKNILIELNDLKLIENLTDISIQYKIDFDFNIENIEIFKTI